MAAKYAMSAIPDNVLPLVVEPDSYLTLRYRVVLPDGSEAVSTFGMNPATLMLGSGQLAENLEHCLIGMRQGQRQAFTLEPEAAFGLRNPELVRRVGLSALPRELEEEAGSRIAFTDASGAEFAGTLVEKGEDDALFDFNHPLAGLTIVFEAEILAIM
jgi:FKBP-type peptidyl-prolyl cis-trans isomerase SlpA